MILRTVTCGHGPLPEDELVRQTLFYIPPTLFGLPVFGCGLAFGLLIVAVAIAVGWRFSRVKKFDEDIGSYLGLLVVGGAALVFVVPNVLQPQGFPIRGFGVFLLLAILAALGLLLRLAKSRGISSDTVFSLSLWSVVSGLIGARLFYVTEYWHGTRAFDSAGNFLPWKTFFNILNIADGGIVVYGSILGGLVGAILFMWLNRLPILSTLDIMAPTLMIGIAIGRIGCLMNGCCFGGVCELPWAITFPEGSPAHIHQVSEGKTFYDGLKFEYRDKMVVIREVQPGSSAEKKGLKSGMVLNGVAGMVDHKPQGGRVLNPLEAIEMIHFLRHANPQEKLRFDVYTAPDFKTEKSFFVGPTPSVVLSVHPTQIYSSFGAACICGVLLFLGRLNFFRRQDGFVFVAFLFLYSMGRFYIETIRTDEDSFLGTGLTVSQNICIVVFLAACMLGGILARRTMKIREECANQ